MTRPISVKPEGSKADRFAAGSAKIEAGHIQQDARFQERGIRAKVPLSACSSLQHLQRPTPSHLSQNAPTFRASAMKMWHTVVAVA